MHKMFKLLDCPQGKVSKDWVKERVGGCLISFHGHSSDWLVVRQLGVNIINLLVPVSLGSTCLWANYSSTWWGFQHLQNSSRIWLRVLSIALEEELKVLDFV